MCFLFEKKDYAFAIWISNNSMALQIRYEQTEPFFCFLITQDYVSK